MTKGQRTMNDYKLVPAEPTQEMLNAPLQGGRFENRVDLRPSIYRAMLAASPTVKSELVGEIGSNNNCPVAYWDKSLPVGAKLYTAPQPAEEIGEVVVTKDKMGNIVSVTRQDAEGRVLSIIAESEGISQSSVLAEGYFHPLPDESDYEFHDAEKFPDGSDCPACVPAVIVRRSAVENATSTSQHGMPKTSTQGQQLERYKAVEGSESAHCCFEASVVETHSTPGGDPVCECFDIKTAHRIANALNTAKQTPDTSQLVEALEAIERMDYSDHSLINAVLVARTAIASHRKGGGQ